MYALKSSRQNFYRLDPWIYKTIFFLFMRQPATSGIRGGCSTGTYETILYRVGRSSFIALDHHKGKLNLSAGFHPAT